MSSDPINVGQSFVNHNLGSPFPAASQLPSPDKEAETAGTPDGSQATAQKNILDTIREKIESALGRDWGKWLGGWLGGVR